MKSLKFFIILLTIAFVSCTKKTQTTNSRNDSVEKYLKLASIDTLPLETRKGYNKKAFSFIDLEKNDTTVRWYLGEISLNFNVLKDSSNYYKTSKIHLEKTLEVNDSLNMLLYYRYRAGHHKNNTSYKDSSFKYYLLAEKISKGINDNIGLARIYLNKGILQFNVSDYTGAEYSILKAYKFLKKTNFKSDQYSCLNYLGNINHTMKNYKKAIEYHKKTLIFLNKNNNIIKEEFGYSYIGTTLNNIGNSYRESKDFNNAIYYFKKALNNKKEIIKDVELKGFLYNNLVFYPY